jgi:hypothetical protein
VLDIELSTHKCFVVKNTNNIAMVKRMAPTCSMFKRTENLKATMRTAQAKEGEGVGNRKLQGEKKTVRTAVRVAKKKLSATYEREAMLAAGLFLCDERCDKTGRYCSKLYQSESDKDRYWYHDCMLPGSENARDYLSRESAKTGGLLAAGSCPNRQNKNLSESIVASEDGAVTEIGLGASARSIGREQPKRTKNPTSYLRCWRYSIA